MEPVSYLKFSGFLKIVYSLTLGTVVAWFMFFYLAICFDILAWTGHNIFEIFLVNLPIIFSLCACPLGVFVLFFLTKGGGLNFFRSWNAGSKLYIPAAAIIIGYLLVIFTPNTSVRHTYAPTFYDFYYTYFGLALIVFGLISLIILKRHYLPTQQKTGSRFNFNRKRLFIVFCVVLISSIIIGGFHYKINRETEYLRQDFNMFREGFPHLVNDQWVDNVGELSNYVNYKGSLFNSGIQEVYNVTLLVTLRDANNNLLKRTEYVVGDIEGWNYQNFDFNIEYIGKLAELYAGYKWNEPI